MTQLVELQKVLPDLEEAGFEVYAVTYDTPEELNAATPFSFNTSQRPNFVNEAAHDYHLAPEDTVARDTGADLSAYFTTDQDGVVRPQGGVWDRGAYEGAGEPDVESPSAPSARGATAASESRIDLTRLPSSDNTSVSGYRIYRDGAEVGTALSVNYTDTGLSASTPYSNSAI